MTELPEYIRVIMERHFQGQDSPEDRRQLQQWRGQHPDHEEEYLQMMQVWSLAGEALAQPPFDAAKAWQSMENRIKQDKSVHPENTYPYQEPSGPSEQETVQRKKTGFLARLPLAGRIAAAATLTGAALLTAIYLFHGYGRSSSQAPGPMQSVSATSGNRSITLADGSVVQLRQGAVLTWPVNFGEKERRISLTGEAFFDIHADKDRPFRIHTERSAIEVLGTSFLVEVRKDADRLVVATGRVLFADKAAPERHCILTGQQEARFSGKEFEQKAVSGVNYLSWQTGDLRFDGTPLDQVAIDLSHHYGTEVRLSGELVSKAGMYKVTGDFRNQPLDQPLEEITALTGLHYRREGDSIILY